MVFVVFVILQYLAKPGPMTTDQPSGCREEVRDGIHHCVEIAQ